MIVYEVNLLVDREVSDAYLAWLRPHIDEMLTFPGFLDARLWRRDADDEGEEDDGRARYTVHYHLEDRASLEAYFQGPAARMREDGLQRFGGRFQATRRILQET